MRLHTGGKAPNPRRVQIFMAEKGIDIDEIQYDINALEHKSESFHKLNPLGTLPTLELDDGTVISETIAICRYLEFLHPEPNLMGADGREAAIIEMWQRRIEFYFLMPVAFSFRHLHPGAKVIEPVQINAWGELNQPRALKFMRFLDAELATRSFVSGERFTVADITAFVTCQFLKPGRLSIPDELLSLNNWFERIGRRPSTVWE